METKKFLYGGILVILLALAYYSMNNLNPIPVKYSELNECNNITDDLFKGTCYQKIAMERNDSTICDLAPTIFSVSECYTRIARINEDPSICDNINNKTLADNCNHNLAVLKNAPDVCEKITYADSKYKCLAITKKDPVSCESIVSDSGYDWCLYAVAVKLEDALICENIISDEIRDKCYLGYVERNSLGSGFCNRIVDLEIRNECRDVGITYSCPLNELKTDRRNISIV